MKHQPLIVHELTTSDVVCSCTGKDCSNHPMCHMLIGYMCGRKKPNYPVPAIASELVEATISSHSIMFWKGNEVRNPAKTIWHKSLI